jgi:hypothetical protein
MDLASSLRSPGCSSSLVSSILERFVARPFDGYGGGLSNLDGHSGQFFLRCPILWHLKHRPSLRSLAFSASFSGFHPWTLVESIFIGTTSSFFLRWVVLVGMFERHLACLVLRWLFPFGPRASFIMVNLHTCHHAASCHSSNKSGQFSLL